MSTSSDAARGHREIASPLTETMLTPLSDDVSRVQLRQPLLDAEWERLGDFMRSYPEVTLRVYSGIPKGFANLDFLRFFSGLRRIWIDLFELKDFTGLRFLDYELRSVALGNRRTTAFSLKSIERFAHLESVSIAGKCKDAEVLFAFKKIKSLGLHGGSLKSLEALHTLPALISLAVTGGKLDCTPLGKLSTLQHLLLGRIGGLSNIDWLSNMGSLQTLSMHWQPQIDSFPSLKASAALHEVRLETMNGLIDAKGLAEAPNLKNVRICIVPLLSDESRLAFERHPAIDQLFITPGPMAKK